MKQSFQGNKSFKQAFNLISTKSPKNQRQVDK